MSMRIDQFLAQQGGGSRRAAQALVRAGRVSVNGDCVRSPQMHIDPQRDEVSLDGEAVVYQAALHIMLNKPAGVLTAARDPRSSTVMDLLPRRLASMHCMPIGRLDRDTEGLLLFTTDGQLAHRLLSPRRQVHKVYWAQVDLPLCDADVDAFAQGIALSDFMALPATLQILPGAMSGMVTVCEGKFHQVKRMFQARGKTVLCLRRIAFGGVCLPDSLAPGQWRELTGQELDILIQASGGISDG